MAYNQTANFMNNSIVISQKALVAELFYMFFWQRICFTPKTNEVWIIKPHYSGGRFEINLHQFGTIGQLDKASYTLEFWAAYEVELRSCIPHDYGKCFERKMDELLSKVDYFKSGSHIISDEADQISGLLHEFWNRTSDACPLDASLQEKEENSFKRFVTDKYNLTTPSDRSPGEQSTVGTGTTDFTKDQIKEFNKVVRPAMQWLAENTHPHAQITISSTVSELMDGVISTGEVLDFIKD